MTHFWLVICIVDMGTRQYLKGIQHALPGDNDLLGLLLYGEGSDQGSHFLSRLPLGQLTKTFLAGPDRGVDDLQEKLTGTWIEDEDGPVDGLGGQVSLKGLKMLHQNYYFHFLSIIEFQIKNYNICFSPKLRYRFAPRLHELIFLFCFARKRCPIATKTSGCFKRICSNMYERFVRPILVIILCVWEMWSSFQ